MSRIGILLACDHYPRVSDDPLALDAQFRKCLEALGLTVDRLQVFDWFTGDTPSHAGMADVWIVSGTPITGLTSGCDPYGDLLAFLRAADALGSAVIGLNHGEQVLHAALALPGAPIPGSPSAMRAIRNPFRSFLSRDRLFLFDPIARRIRELPRPSALTLRAQFRAIARAA